MISLEQHIKSKNLALGESIKDRKKIYLDTKFWVDFCNISLSKNSDKDAKEVYETCKILVDGKKAIFPISYRIFIELIKQTDKETLFKTVEIIDNLSQGITVISEDERVDLEILYFLRSNMQQNDLYEPTELVWTKISNVMGILLPELPLLSHKENLEIKIKFFDRMWNINLYGMISEIGINGIRKFPKSNDFSNILNKGKFENLKQNNTAHQIYMSEIAGILDVNEQKISSWFEYLYREEHESSTINMDKNQKTCKPLINIIYHIFNKQKNELFLPTWDIMAKIHAMIRWDEKRKYRNNDSNDIGHIVTALPYFDYFFTERSFASLIIQTKYDKKYNCHVAWKYDEVLNVIKKLICDSKDTNAI